MMRGSKSFNRQRFLGVAQKGRRVGMSFLHLGMIQASNALVQLLLFPLIIRKTGLDAFGPVVVANALAALISMLVNYGTGISAIQSVAETRKEPKLLSQLCGQVFTTRLSLTLAVALLLPFSALLFPRWFVFLAPAMVLVLAEALNPLFLFSGREELLPFNAGNLVAKLVSCILILLFVNGPDQAPLVNLYLGLPALVVYVLLNRWVFGRIGITLVPARWEAVRALLRNNLPLVGNNVAVHLQQSLLLFVLSATASPVLLAGYAVADKLVWGFRLLLIALSNALFPQAVALASTAPVLARRRKRQINLVLAGVFTVVALVLFLEPVRICQLFTGSVNAEAVALIRAVCLVPLLAALNMLNVLEMLVLRRYADIFRIAGLLTGATVLLSAAIIGIAGVAYVGWYPVLIEAIALLLYLTFLQRRNKEVPLAA